MAPCCGVTTSSYDVWGNVPALTRDSPFVIVAQLVRSDVESQKETLKDLSGHGASLRIALARLSLERGSSTCVTQTR